MTPHATSLISHPQQKMVTFIVLQFLPRSLETGDLDGAIPSLELGGTGLETGDRGTGERETGERGVGEGGTGERGVGIRGMEVRLVGPEDGGFCMCVGGGGGGKQV